MPYFSVAVLSANCFGDGFVASIPYKRGRNSIGDLRGKEDVTGARCADFDNFVEEDYEIGEPCLNTEVVKYMADSITDLLFQ